MSTAALGILQVASESLWEGCRDPAALVNGARDRQLCVSLTGRVCTGRLAVSGGVLDEIMFESVATVR